MLSFFKSGPGESSGHSVHLIRSRVQTDQFELSAIKTDVVHEEQHLFHADRAKSRAAAAAEAHVHPSTLAKVQALPTEYREQQIPRTDRPSAQSFRSRQTHQRLSVMSS